VSASGKFIAIILEGIRLCEERKPNTLVAFDPKAKSFQKWEIPSGGGVVRNMVATPDRRLYLVCSGVNKVAIATVSR